MSLAHSAQRAKKPQSLQVLEDLKKIKTEPTEAAESLDNEPHAAHRKQETSLDKEEHLYGNSSSSELSELEEPEPDDAPSIAENEEAQLVMKKPRTRSSRRRNTAKTYAEPDSSSEDVGEHYKGRGIVVKNTWTLNGSEESEIDSTASYTSDNSSDSSDTKSEASGFSHGIRGEETEGEMDAGLDADSLDEHSDRVQSFPLRRSDSEQGKRSKIPKAKFKYMVTHGRLNEAQRRKPWEVIAEECGVTASLEDISQALKQAGIPYGDRLGPVAHASPPAATPLQERKRSATTIVLEDSESEDIMPTPKRRRDTVPESRRTHRSPASYRRHPQNIFSRDRNSNVEKFPRLTTPLPPATALVEPVLRKSDEPLVTETPRNNANEDLFLRNGDIDVNSLPAVGKAPRPGTAARRIIAKANTTLPPTNDNISESFATSKNLATSALQKRKNMVWNC